jgi:hypothetical protein
MLAARRSNSDVRLALTNTRKAPSAEYEMLAARRSNSDVRLALTNTSGQARLVRRV